MVSKKFYLFFLLANIFQIHICFAQISKEERGDSFKWVLVTNKNTGERGVENPNGNMIVPMGKYMITYQGLNGGYFQLSDNGKQAAYSTEGKILIPFSRGYDRIVKHGNYYGVRKNGLEGACDDDGFEIIEPKYSSLFYSSIDGFNTKNGDKHTPLGIAKRNDGTFSGVDYSMKSSIIAQQLASNSSQTYSATTSPSTGQSLVSNTSSVSFSASGTTDKDQYRRSSLCLVLLTHRDKKYAEAMERVFKNFPLPLRYNEHNISDIRVISVYGHQSKKDIDRILQNNNVAQKVVGKWFNRSNYTGRMNMDLIHERGGYGASYADYERSKANVRGAAMLQDEGVELLQSTFVLVCDMTYKDKSKSFWKGLGEVTLVALSGAMQGAAQYSYQQAQQQYMQGNYAGAQNSLNATQTYANASYTAAQGAKVVADIGGFRVKMKAYLYKLRWDDDMTQRMYRDYWTDYQTSYSEAQERKKKFDDAKYTFKLDYIGDYSKTSSKTILRSWKNEDEVILDVCERTVNKGMTELAKKFPIFRPRAPFYFDGGDMYSHIGTKEEVSSGKKYDILQPYKDKHGQICYNIVGLAIARSVWNNRNIRFDRYFDDGNKGTRFMRKKSSVDLHLPGLQLRER